MRFVERVRHAWASGSLWPRARRYLWIRISRPIEVLLGYPLLPSEARRLEVKSGRADHRASPAHLRSNPEHLRRITAAYIAAKRAESTAPGSYRIHGIWAEILKTNFEELISAANSGDLS